MSILVALCLLPSCRTKEEMSFSMDPVENVEALWQIIDTRYCYIEEKGIDWNAIHGEYIAKAEMLERHDPVALFDLCAAMLDSLRDGHVNLYTPFDVSRCTAWYDTFPASFNSQIQALYLKDYRVAGGLYYCTIANDSIGYVYYPSFSSGFSSSNIYWIFTAFKDCKGLIIDVRNNGGGSFVYLNDSIEKLKHARFCTEVERFFNHHAYIIADSLGNYTIGDDLVGKIVGDSASGSFIINTAYKFVEKTPQQFVSIWNDPKEKWYYKEVDLLDGTLSHQIACQYQIKRIEVDDHYEYEITYTGEGAFDLTANYITHINKVIDWMAFMNDNVAPKLTLGDIETGLHSAGGDVSLEYKTTLK